MVFSYNWLQSFFHKKLPQPEKLAELLTMHFAEVEAIEKKGKDYTLDIDVRPSRAGDCFSHIGIARELAAILNLKIKYPKANPLRDKKTKAGNFIKIEVMNKNACPRYTAGVVKDIRVGPSPKWLEDRLMVCGLRPINNIVDVTNYVMLETGQPLHAFDGEKLEGKKLVVRYAKKGERIFTLDQERYELTGEVLIIADSKKPVAVAGIKGGKLPEIDNNTKIVVLESANFRSQTVRKGSQNLNLKTDASLRFEHGIDPNLTELAISRAAYLIGQIANGKVASGLVDFYPKKSYPRKVKLDLKYAESLLGIKLSAGEVKKILKALELKIVSFKDSLLLVEVPTFRLDITIPEDLIEEIGRIYGYEKIPAVFPQASLIPPEKNQELFWENKVKDILKEAGFVEFYNYSFLASGFGELVELKNPLSKEQKYLRNSLIPNLLKNIENNKNYVKPGEEMKIFELGKIFLKSKKEKKMLTGVLKGDNKFYEGKGAVDLLLQKIGISNVWYDDFKATPEHSPEKLWNLERCAEIKVNNQEIGFLGEIKKGSAATIFDFDFEALQKLASEEREYRPPSRYPAAVRDLAVLVPRTVKMEEVLNKIESAGGILVVDIDLFDIYEGEQLPEGKKNLAFRIVYQAEDKTLSSKEIDDIQTKIIKALEQDPEWQVRR